MSNTTSVIACLGLAVPLFACAAPPGPGGPSENTVVEFGYDGLNPKTVHISADGNITWVNLASDSRGFILLPESISTSFSCGEDLAPYFQRVEGGYESLPIDSLEPRRVQLPCPLAPGVYDYEIRLMNAGLAETGSASAKRKLDGKIVVE